MAYPLGGTTRQFHCRLCNTEQLLLRTGVKNHFAFGNALTAAWSHKKNYVFESIQDGPQTTEHRIWQQFLRAHRLGLLKLEHSARTEQQFANSDSKKPSRVRLMGFWPLNT